MSTMTTLENKNLLQSKCYISAVNRLTFHFYAACALHFSTRIFSDASLYSGIFRHNIIQCERSNTSLIAHSDIAILRI